ncbi:MAG: hypothetical protein JW787_12410 [Sedimentisphaerales bacterium]|nr:hypothetical protein [Sedimentisphaerales bacterium]
MNNKLVLREMPDYTEFLDTSFEILKKEEKEELLFGGQSEAVDAYIEEYPNCVQDQNIEIENPFDEFDNY